jgi:predicted TPR repeat methyltransferase
MPTMDYDDFAEAYAADNEVNLLNGHYERPAVVSLAGDVDGRRILDVGCGAGPLSAALRDKGAIMSGFDLSAEMIALARRRLGENADLRVADLAKPLPYADAAFDDVVASLVLLSDAFTTAGFRISAISEPPIAPDTPSEVIPEHLKDVTRFISFIFFVLEAC